VRQSSLTFLYLASGATKYESQEVGLKYMADVKKEVVDERAQVRATHGHTRPHTATHGHTRPHMAALQCEPARTRVGSRDARMRRPRPSPPATRHPPPPAATAHAATAHAAPHRSSPPPHVPQVAALGKLLGIDCEALSKAEPSP